MALTECLKRAEENLMDCQNCGTRGASSLSTAYAGFRFTTSLVMALKGAEDVIECAFVKSDVIPELEYLASPLKLGIRGIEYNFGYPPLSDYEVRLMEQAAPALINDIEMGKCFVEQHKREQKKYYRRCTPKKTNSFINICTDLPSTHCCLEEPPEDGCSKKKPKRDRRKPSMIEAVNKEIPKDSSGGDKSTLPEAKSRIILRCVTNTDNLEEKDILLKAIMPKSVEPKSKDPEGEKIKKERCISKKEYVVPPKKVSRKEVSFFQSVEVEETSVQSERAKPV